ncbi:MAG TPA: hypothetical protein VFY60_16105 [Pyrinomonadaceae bacterium]|nr:hypothetical protein [Pyrinomonadaceae bacterium]
MQSVFTKFAKRNLIIAQLLLLAAVLFSLFMPRSGFTYDGVKQVELAVKNPNGSALWVTNLGADDTKLTVGNRPFDSTVTHEPLHASEVIAAGRTVRLDNSLPAHFRGSDLFIRSKEDVATLMAPVDFAVNSAEFFSASSRQENSKPQAVPKWVTELGGIGETGNNVFDADEIGYAPAVKGQTETGKRYAFGVGVALTKAKSSVEFKLISRAGETIKSLVLSSSRQVFWQAPLGEFASGTYEYPSRIEMRVLAGTAQGFLSIKDLESGQFTPLPIAPFAGDSSLQRDEEAMAEEETTESGTGGPMLREESSVVAAQSGYGGYAYFSNGVYDSRYTSYTYHVYNAPANVCGTLHIRRNGNQETNSGWICTNSVGQATKGPWTGSTNQTGENIRIVWPNNSYTVGGDYKVDDPYDPSVWSNQYGGYGVPIPSQFNGSGYDPQWGTGFYFGSGGWSHFTAAFRKTNQYGQSHYYDGWGYNSSSPVYFPVNASPYRGFNISWWVTPPPQSAHNSYDTYEWCVYSRDLFYPCSTCVPFYGPR